jgi:hypothetical protein
MVKTTTVLLNEPQEKDQNKCYISLKKDPNQTYDISFKK